MKSYLRIFSVVVTISFLSLGCMNAQEPTKTLSEATDFNLRDLEHNTFSLSNFRDKQPVLLFFWTTWCPFCRQELRTLNSRYTQLISDGLEVFAIDVGEPAYKVDRSVKNYSLVLKVLLDEDMSVADGYGILGIPAYILINKQGQIVFQGNRFPRKYKELISD